MATYDEFVKIEGDVVLVRPDAKVAPGTRVL